MADPETSSQAALVRGEDDERQDSSVQSWRGWTGKKLHSHGFQSTIFTLIVIDCIIVIIELCYVLLDTSCPRKREENHPSWLRVLSYISIGISCLFVLELPPHLFAFGFSYYNPFSDVEHSTFHFFDATVIISNFGVLFLRGPAQEIVGLLVILRLWRLIKLLGGVATGVGEINHSVRDRLEQCEKELAAKTQELEETTNQLQNLQRKLDAMQP